MEPKRVLIVDDEEALANALGRFIAARGFDVAVALTGAEALARLAADGCDAVFLDNGLPDRIGLSLIPEIRKGSDAVIIMMTGYAAREEETDARLLGASAFLQKPFDFDVVAKLLDALPRR
ncbi:MAG: hypothetical protein CO113_15580 [Elusimicrobia bacterium CG_4_9_14_3_um_filter_62_55]|nr:MAG: hypothetical protein COX66_19030 [Elusimicrobia bacterium CG_4_10_14_0_2_um_filter_63_34]PJB24128.1 MAG: hypothetical protein CO113_15580 [Elusimicrobia bacterium CG_4_9_14_3_um_filter_62_55]